MGEFQIDLAIVVAGAATSLLLFWPRLSNSTRWRATVTPLASIIGSGFLVLGPILIDSFGHYAVLAMAGLCLAGYGFGAAIRYNIAQIARSDDDESGPDDGVVTLKLETIASWALALAYIVSVAYYLNLLGSFGARLFDVTEEGSRLAGFITSGVYAVILAAGVTKGFSLLEWMEKLSVSVKLTIIAALIAGLTVFSVENWPDALGDLMNSQNIGWSSLPLLFGLIVTVQGFETSRYLGNEYSAEERQKSMRLAQWISTVIYLVYVALLSVGFRSGDFPANETAVIDMMAGVASILVPLLIMAALSAQFSAAVADTQGSGGLVEELTGGKVSSPKGYALVVVAGLVLTWTADVFQIISYASRAFAFYYGLQSGLAFARCWSKGSKDGSQKPGLLALFAALTALGLASAIFGVPFEGN